MWTATGRRGKRVERVALNHVDKSVDRFCSTQCAVDEKEWLKEIINTGGRQDPDSPQISCLRACVRQLFTIYTFILTGLKRGKISFACLSKFWKISRTGMTSLLGDRLLFLCCMEKEG